MVRVLGLVGSSIALPRLRVTFPGVTSFLYLRIPGLNTLLPVHFGFRSVASVDLRLIPHLALSLVNILKVAPGGPALILVAKLEIFVNLVARRNKLRAPAISVEQRLLVRRRVETHDQVLLFKQLLSHQSAELVLTLDLLLLHLPQVVLPSPLTEFWDRGQFAVILVRVIRIVGDQLVLDSAPAVPKHVELVILLHLALQLVDAHILVVLLLGRRWRFAAPRRRVLVVQILPIFIVSRLQSVIWHEVEVFGLDAVKLDAAGNRFVVALRMELGLLISMAIGNGGCAVSFGQRR